MYWLLFVAVLKGHGRKQFTEETDYLCSPFQRAKVCHGRDRVAAGGLSGKLRHHISTHVQEAKKELDA